jgi:trk system potassium uptake protein TrkH
MSGGAQGMMILWMLVGGSPGSTAGGMKTTTAAVLFANSFSVFRRKKSAQLFGRRIEEDTVRNAATLFLLYLTLPMIGAAIISIADGFPIGTCLFETVSAIGTVGLSMGITPSLGHVSRLILILLMFFGRVGGLTLIYAAIHSNPANISRRPVEKIIVG